MERSEIEITSICLVGLSVWCESGDFHRPFNREVGERFFPTLRFHLFVCDLQGSRRSEAIRQESVRVEETPLRCGYGDSCLIENGLRLLLPCQETKHRHINGRNR